MSFEILNRLRKHGLTLDDLHEIAGEDLRHPDPDIRKKARQVEICWEQMAALGVQFADLERFLAVPANRARYPHQLAKPLKPKSAQNQIQQQNQLDTAPTLQAVVAQKTKQEQTLNFSLHAYCAAEPEKPANPTEEM
jgi:hypothetical protein